MIEGDRCAAGRSAGAASRCRISSLMTRTLNRRAAASMRRRIWDVVGACDAVDGGGWRRGWVSGCGPAGGGAPPGARPPAAPGGGGGGGWPPPPPPRGGGEGGGPHIFKGRGGRARARRGGGG